MAVAYESVATASSATVGKPSGLAVGDLMIAHLSGSNDNNTTMSAYSLTDWTLIAGIDAADAGNTNVGTALYKIATSGDVAASDFSFTTPGNAQTTCGAIYRFSGGGIPSGVADGDTAGSSPHTFTNTVTPSTADSMLLLLVSCANSGAASFDGYAVVTDNPTWSERVDFSNTGGPNDGDTTIAGATAPRSQTSATGNSSVTSAGYSPCVGILCYIPPRVDATSTPAVFDLTLAFPAPAVSASGTPDPLVLTLSFPSSVATTPAPDWTNTDKTTPPAWINPDKS